MLKVLLKETPGKTVNYVNSKNRGKKMNLQFSPNSEYFEDIKRREAGDIYSPVGAKITGKLSKKNPETQMRSPERVFSISKKVFPEKQIKSERTLQPKLQSINNADSYIKKNGLYKISSYFCDYNHNYPTDVLNIKKKNIQPDKIGKKIVPSHNYKNFEFSDEPTEFRRTGNLSRSKGEFNKYTKSQITTLPGSVFRNNNEIKDDTRIPQRNNEGFRYKMKTDFTSSVACLSPYKIKPEVYNSLKYRNNKQDSDIFNIKKKPFIEKSQGKKKVANLLHAKSSSNIRTFNIK